jgi:hypothetical protein
MLVYDVAEILARKAAKDAQPRPEPQMLMPEVMHEARQAVEQQVEDLHDAAEYLGQKHTSLKDALTADLVAQMRDLKVERGKLSNKYMPMIRAGATQAEICAHYERIEGLREASGNEHAPGQPGNGQYAGPEVPETTPGGHALQAAEEAGRRAGQKPGAQAAGVAAAA